MPWTETCPVLERWKFVEAALRKERPFAQLCRDAGITRATGYTWLNRFKQSPGINALQDQSRAPHRSPARTSADIETRIRALREKFSAGGVIIAKKLEEEGVRISPRTVDRVLSRLGLVKEQDRHPPATKRFQRARPNQLWQMDFKGPVTIGRSTGLPLSILDDHSRYLVALRAHRSTDGASVFKTLKSVFREYGMPDAILTDHGTPWWSTTNQHGLTWLGVWLIELDVNVIYSGIRHPQTQGKVERFHRTLKRWLADRPQTGKLPAYLAEYRDLYNFERPHSAIEFRVPGDVYTSSSRPYSKPEPWLYPEGALLRNVDAAGAITYRHRRYFVCEALVGKTVTCRELDGLLLVIFRHMIVREINLRNGTTQAVVITDEEWAARHD